MTCLLPADGYKGKRTSLTSNLHGYTALASIITITISSCIGYASEATLLEPQAVFALCHAILIREVVIVAIFRWQG